MADLTHRLETKTIVFTVKLPRMFGARMWLTRQFLKLAALVCPCTIEIAND